jgi:helicase MOV-10
LNLPSFSVAHLSTAQNLTSRNPIQLTIAFKQTHIGRYEDRLELVFEDIQIKKRFFIARTLKAIVGNKADHEALQPKAPYVPRTRSRRNVIAEKDIVEGVKPPALNAIRYVVVLPKAKIPTHLHNILAGSETTAKVTATVRKVFMPQVFNSDTYGRHFKHLLWAEEFKSE